MSLILAGAAQADARAVAAAVAADPARWRPSVRHDEAERWFARLDAVGGHDVWLIGWPRGTGVPLHDHGGAGGAFTVVEGRLLESYVEHAAPAPHAWRSIERGAAVAFGPAHVHAVTNLDDRLAVSIHAYAPRLRAMTFFCGDDGVLRASRSELVDDPVVGAAR